MVDENFSCENKNDTKERRREKGERGEGKKRSMQPCVFILATLEIVIERQNIK